MTETQIKFDDGSTYERSVGVWSRLIAEPFLRWLSPAGGKQWLDVGCGSGVFSAVVAERASPGGLHGVDPSENQLEFARTRLPAPRAEFRQGDAMALPYPSDAFDAAVMALVIAFVPQPAKGVAEMARVVSPGGIVAAYMWDYSGTMPTDPIPAQAQALGRTYPRPPNTAIAEIGALRALWDAAGLESVETRRFDIARRFANFDDFWDTTAMIASVAPMLAGLSDAELAGLKSEVRALVPDDAAGGITRTAGANAVKGRVKAAT